MQGAPALRRGCRRSPRKGRPARSRRSATRRPRGGGRGSAPPWRAAAARMAYWSFLFCRQVPFPDSLQGQRLFPAGAAPVERISGQAEEDLAGEGVVARVQRCQLGHKAGDISVAGQAVEQDSAGGDGGLKRWPFPSSPIQTLTATAS